MNTPDDITITIKRLSENTRKQVLFIVKRSLSDVRGFVTTNEELTDKIDQLETQSLSADKCRQLQRVKAEQKEFNKKISEYTQLVGRVLADYEHLAIYVNVLVQCFIPVHLRPVYRIDFGRLVDDARELHSENEMQ